MQRLTPAKSLIRLGYNITLAVAVMLFPLINTSNVAAEVDSIQSPLTGNSPDSNHS